VGYPATKSLLRNVKLGMVRVLPPSTKIIDPVIYPAASEAENRQAFAISSFRPTFCSGIV